MKLTTEQRYQIAEYMAEETNDYKAGASDVLYLLDVPVTVRKDIREIAKEIKAQNEKERASKGIH